MTALSIIGIAILINLLAWKLGDWLANRRRRKDLEFHRRFMRWARTGESMNKKL